MTEEKKAILSKHYSWKVTSLHTTAHMSEKPMELGELGEKGILGGELEMWGGGGGEEEEREEKTQWRLRHGGKVVFSGVVEWRKACTFWYLCDVERGPDV